MYKYAGWWDSFKAGLQRMLGLRPYDAQAERHFRAKEPDWHRFNDMLTSPKFREAITSDPRADTKLKKFTQMQGRILEHDGPTAKVLSTSGLKSYDVQYHKDIGRYTCTCPDFKYKQTFSPGGECKHIQKIKADGGLKLSTIQSFGAEYAAILDSNPTYKWRADSAQTRQLRAERDAPAPLDELAGRLHTTAEEPRLKGMMTGGDFIDGYEKERAWEQPNAVSSDGK